LAHFGRKKVGGKIGYLLSETLKLPLEGPIPTVDGLKTFFLLFHAFNFVRVEVSVGTELNVANANCIPFRLKLQILHFLDEHILLRVLPFLLFNFFRCLE
jgi:hypothetical protein